MSDDLNDVKTVREPIPKTDPKPDAYHHGGLREALIAAAETVIAERGVDGFSLREAARRAGVSAAAPQHHFGDARGLLTAIATEAFVQLSEALAQADAGGEGDADPRQRLRRQGAAYVRFALSQPARFDVMWRKARIDPADPAYLAASTFAFALLTKAAADVEGIDDQVGAIAAWSLVHGFARLALDGVFGADPGAAEAAADAILGLIMERLR